jgi:SAM-dependent methyltransferase
MVEQAQRHAARCGVALEAEVQDLAHLTLPPASFDAVALMAGMYSAFPTRQRRIGLLRQVRQVLQPGGYFLCQFFYQEDPHPRRGAEWVRKALAWLTLGNLTYERGDVLFGGREFFHFFVSEPEVRQEFAEAGFAVYYLYLSGNLSGAVLQAPAAGGQ